MSFKKSPQANSGPNIVDRLFSNKHPKFQHSNFNHSDLQYSEDIFKFMANFLKRHVKKGGLKQF